MNSWERSKADGYWAENQPLPPDLPFAELEGKLTRCSTTGEHLAALCDGDFLPPVQQERVSREQLPEDVFEALGQVMARLEEPRRLIGHPLQLQESWTHVAFIYDAVDLPESALLRRVIESATQHLTLIPIRSPQGARRRRTSQGAEPVQLFRELAHKPPWDGGLLQNRSPSKDALLSGLRQPGLGTYLTHFAPHHVPSGQLRQWQEILGDLTPDPWQTRKEPSRPWYHQVSLLEEQGWCLAGQSQD